jgi:hypothetical protein
MLHVMEVNLSRYPKANRLTKPITQEEILKAYSRAKKNSAAGPDGIDLKKVERANFVLI